MSNIDKIRQEIERLIRMNQTKNGFPAGANCAIRIEAYEHLIPFLDTLPEQPVEIDVDKKWDELQRYFRDINEAFEEGKKSTAKKPEQPVGWDDENAADKKAVKEIVKTVHKEATRQVKEMVKEQPASEGLEEAATFVEEVRKYYSNNCTWDALKQPMLSIITRCARHFYELGRKTKEDK